MRDLSGRWDGHGVFECGGRAGRVARLRTGRGRGEEGVPRGQHPSCGTNRQREFERRALALSRILAWRRSRDDQTVRVCADGCCSCPQAPHAENRQGGSTASSGTCASRHASERSEACLMHATGTLRTHRTDRTHAFDSRGLGGDVLPPAQARRLTSACYSVRTATLEPLSRRRSSDVATRRKLCSTVGALAVIPPASKSNASRAEQSSVSDSVALVCSRLWRWSGAGGAEPGGPRRARAASPLAPSASGVRSRRPAKQRAPPRRPRRQSRESTHAKCEMTK